MTGHVVTETYYNNAWHLLDADMNVIFKKDNHIIAVNNILSNLDILLFLHLFIIKFQ